MLTDTQIDLLKTKTKTVKNIFWRDPDGVGHPVKGVVLKWVEDPNEPDLTEPVAVLASGKVIALYNVELSEFYTAQPLTLGEHTEPTKYVDRVLESLALLCHGRRPPREMVEAWFRDESGNLQDWAVNNAAPYWATGIGTIEGAIAMADTPEEGISEGAGREHEHRDEAFPRPEAPADIEHDTAQGGDSSEAGQ